MVDADVNAAYVFADESEHEHDHAANKEQCGKHAGIAYGNVGEHQFFVNDEQAGSESHQCAEEPDVSGGSERLDGKCGKAVNPKSDETCDGVARFAFEAAAVLYLNVAQILGGAEYESADVGERIGIAHDFIDDELAHDKEACGAERLRLANNCFCHFFVDPASKAAEQMLCGMLVVAIDDIVAFFELIDELECFAGWRLSVIIEADDLVACSLSVACH